MPGVLGKTGSSALNTPNATHSEIFQKGDKVPVQKNKRLNQGTSAQGRCSEALCPFFNELFTRAKSVT